MSAEIAPLLYRELLQLAAHPSRDARGRALAIGVLLERLFLEATRREQLAFSSLFARISYVGHQYQFPADILQVIHYFRRRCARLRDGAPGAERDVRLGARALAETVRLLYQTDIPAEVTDLFPAPGEWHFEAPENWAHKDAARVVALAHVPAENVLLAVEEDRPDQTVKLRYGLPDRNENFSPTIRLILQVFGFPVVLNLLDIAVDEQGVYRPRVFIVEPDYLADVTAIAETFQEQGAEPLYHLAKKFLPYEQTTPMLVGNIANYFLDRLLKTPEAPFDQLLRETFGLYPLAYAPMSDQEVLDVRQKAQKHYLNLRAMADGGLAQQGIEPTESMLEPTFYSARYGLQGRLDLLHRAAGKTAILELKSGRPFRPNSYGIQRSHFTQTLLYDLLARSVFGTETDPVKYILYSGAELNPLRFAPTLESEQWEALQVRNHLVAIERLLAAVPPGADQIPLLAKLTAKNGQGKGFLARDFERFEQAYHRLHSWERKYFNSFVGFVAREALLAKIGAAEADNHSGNAALWRHSFEEKQQNFAILSHLNIRDNRADQEDPWIVFQKTAQTNPLANFRVGDIAVLYPVQKAGDNVLNHQVIKCTITALESDTVTVQLRYRQFNLFPFPADAYWNLEPDMLETGFVGMYRSLFEWAASPEAVRLQIVCPAPTEPADVPAPLPVAGNTTLTAEQTQILQRMTQAPRLFLLWGPPGTGKTSVMLHAYADWVLRYTDDNLLLLAYTNRAVDEICDALDRLGGPIRDQYLRVGSRFSTAERFRGQLLQQRIAGAANRAQLREVLEKRRIYVGTVASFAQNDSLLQLKKFHRLVIDEASQLLEPQLVGLLTRFDQAILIGDHRQLPAVTTQGPEWTLVKDPALNTIGLNNLSDSYFERLYRQFVQDGRTWAYGQLSHQGRMHRDIMAFPNHHFYGGMLKILPGPAGATQEAPLSLQPPADCADWERHLARRRVTFFDVPTAEALPGQKTSRPEAELAVRIICFFHRLYLENGLAWDPANALGVITPWRAQIAQMRECLLEAGENPETLTIDTVERYQGGARDIILVSCCVHTGYQLNSLVNISGEGVDRKLNVALTRARQHVVVLGNREILEKDPRYRAFIEAYRFGA
jgi:DNA replication ATP-dependent helicase Dna2